LLQTTCTENRVAGYCEGGANKFLESKTCRFAACVRPRFKEHCAAALLDRAPPGKTHSPPLDAVCAHATAWTMMGRKHCGSVCSPHTARTRGWNGTSAMGPRMTAARQCRDPPILSGERPFDAGRGAAHHPTARPQRPCLESRTRLCSGDGRPSAAPAHLSTPAIARPRPSRSPPPLRLSKWTLAPTPPPPQWRVVPTPPPP